MVPSSTNGPGLMIGVGSLGRRRSTRPVPLTTPVSSMTTSQSMTASHHHLSGPARSLPHAPLPTRGCSPLDVVRVRWDSGHCSRNPPPGNLLPLREEALPESRGRLLLLASSRPELLLVLRVLTKVQKISFSPVRSADSPLSSRSAVNALRKLCCCSCFQKD